MSQFRKDHRMSLSKISFPKLIFSLLTVIVMVLIFMFSSDNSGESSDKSQSVTAVIAEAFFPDYENMTLEEKDAVLDKAEHIIRKIAHFTIYTALGFCASMTVGKRKLLSLSSAGVLIFCFLYACSDEIHQLFVPGRSGRFTDVLIDTSGSVLGLLISILIFTIIQHFSRRKIE